MQERRTVLITGAARRVGRAIALRLARARFDVLFTFRASSRDANDTLTQLRALNIDADSLQAEFEDDDAPQRVAEWVSSRAPRLDVLVNNASLYLPDDPARLPELMRRHNRVNYEAPVELAHRLAALLRRSNGHVINMLDTQADKPMASHSAYAASKAALASATLALARQLAPEVTVNGIAPGVIEWPDDMPLDAREAYLIRVPLRRPGTPDDAAGLVHYLVTEGSYITGQIIRLDGGRSIA